MKKVPCYKCRVLVEIKDERAIGKLCDKCSTVPANVEAYKKATQKELLSILNTADSKLDDTKDDANIKSDASVTDKKDEAKDTPSNDAEKLW